jgi:pilus assembly protein Flp/PilA
MRHKSFRRFIYDERGATALEYVLIAVLVSIVVIAGARAIGTTLSTMYYGVLIGNLS